MAYVKGKVVILVQNLSVPFDRRVWREATALTEAGYQVSVISPKGGDRDTESRETIDNVAIYRYHPIEASAGLLSYAIEYGHALLMMLYLCVVVYFRRGFDVIQTCSPPDLLFLVTLPFKLLGKKVIFDHHDLSPEIYLAKTMGQPPGRVYKVLQLLEKLTFAFADVVMSTNESHREVAITRGYVKDEDVFVVRNGPELKSIRKVAAHPALCLGKKYLIVYVGMMAVQDGVDHLLRSIQLLRHEIGREDFHVVLMGDGTELDTLKCLAQKLDITDLLTFTGRVSYETVLEGIATADVCVCPDPKIGSNDKSTLVKVIEYMSLGKPVVAFDLKETRVSAGEAALYVTPVDEPEFAEKINVLIESPELRASLGQFGKERVVNELAWEHSKKVLYAAYEAAFKKVGKP